MSSATNTVRLFTPEPTAEEKARRDLYSSIDNLLLVAKTNPMIAKAVAANIALVACKLVETISAENGLQRIIERRREYEN